MPSGRDKLVEDNSDQKDALAPPFECKVKMMSGVISNRNVFREKSESSESCLSSEKSPMPLPSPQFKLSGLSNPVQGLGHQNENGLRS